MTYKIALIGNPNCGKTTLFNVLTKMHQYVGNWTGVTVEKKEGFYDKDHSIELIDLPGVYSLTPYSLEEVITRDYLVKEKPDAVINILDATNLERNLYLTTQLMEFDVKVVLALNMEDVLLKNDIRIDVKRLSEIFQCPAVSVSAVKKKNIDELMDTVKKVCQNPPQPKRALPFDEQTEKILDAIQQENQFTENKRWFQIKMLERDDILSKTYTLHNAENAIRALEKDHKESVSEHISNDRYRAIGAIMKEIAVDKKTKQTQITEKIDRVLLNRWLAFPIFFAVIFCMYFVSIQVFGNLTSDWMEGLIHEKFGGWMKGLLTGANAPLWLVSLICDGIIQGVGTVLSFIPQILMLFLFISLLEDCGYMSRVAFVMDKLFKKIGLSGKSFIPMIVGCGCSVPAVMAARTVENNDERRLTIVLTPFIPCSAKLPVFALFVGAFFPTQMWVAPSMYLLGILMVILGGLLLKKLKIFKSESDAFILELPPYRAPNAWNVLMQLWEKAKSFLIKAGTIILTASVVLWLLQSFNLQFQMVENADQSILADIGRVLSPIFVPIGCGNWQSTVAILSGFFAKETVVSSFSILLGGAEGSAELSAALTALFPSPAAAYAFMAFILLSAPCVAAINAIRREMGSFKWMLFAIGFQTLTGYLVALVIYQGSRLFEAHSGLFVTVLCCLILGAIACITFYRMRKQTACDGCPNRKDCSKRR